MTKTSIFSRSLRDSTAIRALTLLGAGAVASAMFATPALAQASTPTPSNTQADDQTAATPPAGNDIIITGSISRNPAAATASPVVTTTAADLQDRGVTTVADALQLLTANNAGTAPPSWSSFGFATGASAPSLRGLNDAYTLTLFNGMRTAPYPLGDDGYRNFVDINTIPISVVDRIDALLDGASATYGSDAIAGVINVITKRQVTGLHLNGSAGITQRGDTGERRISATAGYGDLDRQGFNVYVNGEYQQNDPLLVRDRGYPFNTADQSRICGTAAQGCLNNGIRNGIQADGSFLGFASTRVPFVRPYSPGLASLGNYQLLSPAQGCQSLAAYTLTAANNTATITRTGLPIAATTPATVCQEDLVNEYRAYNSNITRKGLNARATFKLGSFGEAYVMANYYNTTTKGNNAGPQGFTGSTAAGGIVSTVSAIFLPAYVCSAGTSTIVGGNLTASGCNAGNGTLNPNNPFAAAGNLARLVALPQVTRSTNTDTKTYRLSGGINGSFGDGWNFNLGATASEVQLRTQNNGYIYLQGLMDAIAKGTYNFVDQSQNTAAQIASVFPQNNNKSTSKLTQIMATVDKDLFNLPGGALNVAVTGQFRYEAIHNPSANPANLVNPNARYFGINAVGVDGKRHVWSAGYEITAPIVDMLKVKAEGSYDSYSTGQSRFSPKFEAEFKPIEQIKIRGTYGKGFRIPSFSESFALPTTGYVGASINCASPTFTAFCAAHASNPAYYSGGYSYGLTSSGNPNLKPEKSTSLTAGIVLQPIKSVTFTVDYWSTKITNVIIGATVSASDIAQYYTNNGVITTPGITAVRGIADPSNLAALPLLGFAVGSYKNADSFLAKGIDFSASAKFDITNGIQWKTNANASLLIRLQQTDAGTVYRYDGSLGACNITSCSGAPRWRASWQNTLKFADTASVSLTAYYTSGYSSVATDSGGVYGDCAASALNGQQAIYNNGDPIQCQAKSVFNLDGHFEFTVGKKFTFYGDIQNILDRAPPYDPNAAYGLYQFNPAWGDRLFIGRSFRFGARVDF
ncbi:TonB-dependent siderophore receptor [Sphingomonas bacterium]|uniref:TonB-dependent receptor plug domain-containing protein n=1 Tax=Sphingomonas bacterium TaxID=1895847 RepID=UPI00262A1DEB|nr:TonB-dependent receptor [Sphingomonas bacterium]MDB5680050.1 TonB-dependent receptor [Sphingomonas bacterium]